MLRSIRIKQDFRCFEEGFEIHFQPGVNLLVGDQGTGKSTIAQLILMQVPNWESYVKIDADNGEFKGFDFERDNPRMVRHFIDSIGTMAQVGVQLVSHGQFNRSLINNMLKHKDVLIVLDEPDQALSPRSCYQMRDTFRQSVEQGCQIVASVHNPLLISSQEMVYSLEHREWISSDDFLESQKAPMKEVSRA